MSQIISIPITASGGTFTLDPTTWTSTDITIRLYSATTITLLADVIIQLDSDPIDGTHLTIEWDGSSFTIDIWSFNIPGVNLTQLQLDYPGAYVYDFYDSGSYHRYTTFETTNIKLNGYSILQDESVTLAKIEDLARGHLIVGNSSARPTAVDFNNSGYIGIGDGTDYNSVAQSGDVIFSNAGVSAIQTGVIVNADVNASAAITRSKLASGTADYVVINSGTGVMSQEAQLANSRGGTGLDSSASTGFPTISSGTWSASAIAVDRDLDVSFEAGEVGDFKIYMGFAGTLTNIYAYATKVIAGTDNGTIVPKNNAGTTMATGTVTFTASDARGTAYTVTPSTNNTFVAGDILTFTTAKVTAGGKVHLSLKFTRTA